MAADETTATFAVELKDSVSTGARSAEESLGSLRKSIVGGGPEMRALQSAMSRLKAGGLTGSQAFKDLRDKADALKKSIGASQAEFIKLGGSLDSLKPEKPADGLDQILGSLGRLPGPLGSVGSKLGGLASSGSLAALGLAATVAAVVAVVAVMATFVAAVGAATAALFRYGLAQADARRSELLHLEGLVSIRNAYSRAAGSASELQGTIDRVSDSAAISRTRVAGYAEQLYRAGLRGQTLRDALEGVSTVSAVQGEAMADRFRGMAVAAARTGGSVRRLTDQVQTRLGGTARRMGLSWDRQMERLRESWSAIFRDIRLDGALESLQGVLDLFSQSTVSGRALRVMLTALFQPVLDGLRVAGPSFREFLEGAIIGTQELVILFLRTRNALQRTFGGGASGLGSFLDMTTVGRVVIFGFTGALLACAAVLTIIGVSLAATAAVLLLPLVAIAALAVGFVWLGRAVTGFVSRAGEQLRAIDWSQIGRDMIAGLVRGLGLDGPAMSAIRGLATGLTETLRGALDIRSPSRVFAALGRQIPRGLALGVEAEASVSAGAIEGLGAVPQGGALGATSGGRGGGNVYVSIDGLQVVVGSTDEAPTSIADRIREELERALAGLLVETGGSNA